MADSATEGTSSQSPDRPAANPDPVPDIGTPRADAVLKVAVIRRDGSPAPGLMFRCTLLAGTERSPVSLGSVMLFTDQDGKFEANFGEGNFIGLILASKNWYADQSRVPRSQRAHEIVVSPTATVSVLAEFDDGQPVTSSGMFYPETNPPYVASFALDANGRATVPDVAVDRPLRCEINGYYRAGYANHSELFEPATLTSGATLRVVVPKARDPYGRIRVVFQEEPPAGNRRVLIECEGRSAVEAELPGRKRQWDSDRLMPGFRYRISILGETAWCSEWLNVNKGDVVEVVPTLRPGASAKAVLVDEQGQPVVNGTLGTALAFGFAYQWAGRGLLPQGSQMPVPKVPPEFLSDAKGVVTLAGMPAGSCTLEAEAWDKEPAQVTVTLAEGQTLDLGTITLRKATAEISLTLTGTSPDTKYVVSLCDNDGRDLRPGQLVTSTPFKLTALRRRSYMLYVTTEKGGDVAHQRVELAATSTSVDVTLDVSNLTAAK